MRVLLVCGGTSEPDWRARDRCLSVQALRNFLQEKIFGDSGMQSLVGYCYSPFPVVKDTDWLSNKETCFAHS